MIDSQPVSVSPPKQTPPRGAIDVLGGTAALLQRQWSRQSTASDKSGSTKDGAGSKKVIAVMTGVKKKKARFQLGGGSNPRNAPAPPPTVASAPPQPPLRVASLKKSKMDVIGRRIIGAVNDDWPMYSSRSSDYELAEPIGYGASSVVYMAHFKPLNRSCAVKVIDVDRLGGGDLQRLYGETQLMSLAKHPNILRVRGEWSEGSKLYIAVRLMASGSLHDILRYSHPEGFSEEVIATALKQALQGLEYLHLNGWIHRDVKAANLLVDDDGTVLLADFGVSAAFKDDEKDPDLGARKSFVGTPCWMAPEVVQQRSYNNKADIWSFGITALELALGRPPLALFSPARAMQKTVNDAPPELQLSRPGSPHKYSKAMQAFIAACLRKDPSARPSATELLSHPFFEKSKKKDHLVGAILRGLPPLAERQERQRAGSIGEWEGTRRGSDIWDFAPTVGKAVSSLRWSDNGSIRSFSSATGSRRDRNVYRGAKSPLSPTSGPWHAESLEGPIRASSFDENGHGGGAGGGATVAAAASMVARRTVSRNQSFSFPSPVGVIVELPGDEAIVSPIMESSHELPTPSNDVGCWDDDDGEHHTGLTKVSSSLLSSSSSSGVNDDADDDEEDDEDGEADVTGTPSMLSSSQTSSSSPGPADDSSDGGDDMLPPPMLLTCQDAMDDDKKLHCDPHTMTAMTTTTMLPTQQQIGASTVVAESSHLQDESSPLDSVKSKSSSRGSGSDDVVQPKTLTKQRWRSLLRRL